jgi:hypothetical protein
MKKTSRTGVVQVSTHLDEKLRRQLAEAAEASVRSLSGEIAYRLKTSFARQPEEEAAAS